MNLKNSWEGEKRERLLLGFWGFFDQGVVPRDTEQKEAPIVHKLQRHMKEAECSFNITVLNTCIYFVSL